MKDHDLEDVLTELRLIKEKIDKSPMTNEGFTSITKKVEEIHVGQELLKQDIQHVKLSYKNIENNISQINESLHTPKIGILPQLESVSTRHEICRQSVNEKISEIEEKIDEEIDPQLIILKKNSDEINDLKDWKIKTAKAHMAIVAFIGMTLVGFIVFLVQELTKLNFF